MTGKCWATAEGDRGAMQWLLNQHSLNLVVQASKNPVGDQSRVDVASGHHLAADKVLVVCIDLHGIVALQTAG